MVIIVVVVILIIGESFIATTNYVICVLFLVSVFRKKISVLERAVAWISCVLWFHVLVTIVTIFFPPADMIQKRNTEEMDLANFPPAQDAKPAVAICSVHI